MQQDDSRCVLGPGVGDERLPAAGQIEHRPGGQVPQRVGTHEMTHTAPGALQQLWTHPLNGTRTDRHSGTLNSKHTEPDFRDQQDPMVTV